MGERGPMPGNWVWAPVVSKCQVPSADAEAEATRHGIGQHRLDLRAPAMTWLNQRVDVGAEPVIVEPAGAIDVGQIGCIDAQFRTLAQDHVAVGANGHTTPSLGLSGAWEGVGDRLQANPTCHDLPTAVAIHRAEEIAVAHKETRLPGGPAKNCITNIECAVSQLAILHR